MAIETRIPFSFSAENQYSDAVFIDAKQRVDVKIEGTFVANVSLQRSTDGKATWQDVEVYDGGIVAQSHSLAVSSFFRAGIKTGDYTSGTVSGVLRRT